MEKKVTYAEAILVDEIMVLNVFKVLNVPNDPNDLKLPNDLNDPDDQTTSMIRGDPITCPRFNIIEQKGCYVYKLSPFEDN